MTISNQGAGPLRIGGDYAAGRNPADFETSGTCSGASLAPTAKLYHHGNVWGFRRGQPERGAVAGGQRPRLPDPGPTERNGRDTAAGCFAHHQLGSERLGFRWILERSRRGPGSRSMDRTWPRMRAAGRARTSAETTHRRSLDGVGVTIGGQKAFVDYISPVQVNAELPSNIATGGPLQLSVTTGGATSAPFTINVTHHPGRACWPTCTSGWEAINTWSRCCRMEPTYFRLGRWPVSLRRPAKPGETITMYGIGFGSVTPAFPAGQDCNRAKPAHVAFPDSVRADSSTVDILRTGARL